MHELSPFLLIIQQTVYLSGIVKVRVDGILFRVRLHIIGIIRLQFIICNPVSPGIGKLKDFLLADANQSHVLKVHAAQVVRRVSEPCLIRVGYHKTDKLIVTSVAGAPKGCEDYVLLIPEDENLVHNIRYQFAEDAVDVKIYVKSGDEYEEVTTQDLGWHYCGFEAPGNQVFVRIEPDYGEIDIKYLEIAGVILAVILLIILIIIIVKVCRWRKRRTKQPGSGKKKKKKKQTNSEKTD